MIAPMDWPPEDPDTPLGVPPLAGLQRPALAALLERGARLQRVRPAELLFREGDEPEGIVVVKAGAGEVFRTECGRWRERVGEFEPGDVLAIASTLTGRRHLASARALVPTEVLRISRLEVRRLCRRHPEVALWLRERMEDRLDAMMRRLTWLAAGAAPASDLSPASEMELSA